MGALIACNIRSHASPALGLVCVAQTARRYPTPMLASQLCWSRYAAAQRL